MGSNSRKSGDDAAYSAVVNRGTYCNHVRISPGAVALGAGLLVLAVLATAHAQTEIHRCSNEQGEVIFQQTPCASEPAAAPEAEPPAEQADTDVDSPAPPVPTEIPEPRDEATVAECKKTYRDRIDEIDAQMMEGYTAEQGEAYKEALLALTRELRRCEA